MLPDIQRGPTFPKNGMTLSRLYETFLTYADFEADPGDYNLQLELIRQQEATREHVCAWRKDADGKLVVHGLAFQDPRLRMEITDVGFRRIPDLSPRSSDIRLQRPSRLAELLTLFSPFREISDPLRFVGRASQLRRILDALDRDNTIMALIGDRSVGKTSLARMMGQIAEGNNQLLAYYGLSRRPSHPFTAIYTDASVEAQDIESLLNAVYAKAYGSPPSESEVGSETTVRVGPFARKWSGKTKRTTPLTRESVVDLGESIRRSGSRLLLIVDEFDSFKEPRELASLLRRLSGTGAITAILGSPGSLSAFVGGHPSVARSLVQIELDPLPEVEFKEMFHIANEIAADLLYFDVEAVDKIYRLSGGLPFFGQLFGDILVRSQVPEEGSLPKFLDARRSLGAVTISSNSVDVVRSQLKEILSQYEHCFEALSSRLESGAAVLEALAKDQRVGKDKMKIITGGKTPYARVVRGITSDPDVHRFFEISGGEIRIADPVFRRYLQITRNLTEPMKRL